MVAQGTEERAAAHALKEARLPEASRDLHTNKGVATAFLTLQGPAPSALLQ